MYVIFKRRECPLLGRNQWPHSSSKYTLGTSCAALALQPRSPLEITWPKLSCVSDPRWSLSYLAPGGDTLILQAPGDTSVGLPWRIRSDEVRAGSSGTRLWRGLRGQVCWGVGRLESVSWSTWSAKRNQMLNGAMHFHSRIAHQALIVSFYVSCVAMHFHSCIAH